jgi:hypothetical protein
MVLYCQKKVVFHVADKTIQSYSLMQIFVKIFSYNACLSYAATLSMQKVILRGIAGSCN